MRLLKIHRLKAKTIMRLADQLSFSCLLIGTTMLPAGATSDGATVWTKASEIMQDVYSQIVSISTITAIVCASVALLLMNFSKTEELWMTPEPGSNESSSPGRFSTA